MGNENPDPNTEAADSIAFGYQVSRDSPNVINEYNTDSASTLVTHFFERANGTRFQVLWLKDHFI